MALQTQGSGIVKKAPVAPKWYQTGDPTLHAAPIPQPPGDQTATPLSYGGGGTSGGGVPTPNPSPSPAGSVNIPGFNPDYNALLLSDPAYLAWATAHPGHVADAAFQRQAATRALAAQYGGVPQGFTDTYGDLTPADLAQAAANPFSDTAQLKQQYQNNVENLRRGLAARGQLHSGDLGFGQGQLDTQLGKSQYDLGNQFLQNLRDAIGNYTGAMANEDTARSGAIGQAYQDVTSNPAYQPTPAATATLVPTWQSDYGTPVYKTPEGRLYTVDGNGNSVLYTG